MKRITHDPSLVKAVALLADIRQALRDGVLHRDKNGKILTTDLDILEALMRDGEFQFKVTKGEPRS